MKIKTILTFSLAFNLILAGILFWQLGYNFTPAWPHENQVTGSPANLPQKSNTIVSHSITTDRSETSVSPAQNGRNAVARPLQATPPVQNVASVTTAQDYPTATFRTGSQVQEIPSPAAASSQTAGGSQENSFATPVAASSSMPQGNQNASDNGNAPASPAFTTEPPQKVHVFHMGVPSEEELYRALYGWQAFNAAEILAQKQLLAPSPRQ